ncbi:MAG: hypothetical protein L6Q76_25295 [Polyangiaceae bacterium]|nr:hypothetical protein [Polyangiaceae bacterium]
MTRRAAKLARPFDACAGHSAHGLDPNGISRLRRRHAFVFLGNQSGGRSRDRAIFIYGREAAQPRAQRDGNPLEHRAFASSVAADEHGDTRVEFKTKSLERAEIKEADLVNLHDLLCDVRVIWHD